MRIVTIGAYGYSEASFFGALQAAEVDTFCDVRRRRGMRGPAYAFANSNRLQQVLQRIGIRYLHLIELAPTMPVRELQRAADRESMMSKKERRSLSPNFKEAYTRQCLESWDSHHFLTSLPAQTRVIAIFCVERDPEACHRSLVADRLAAECGTAVEHLYP